MESLPPELPRRVQAPLRRRLRDLLRGPGQAAIWLAMGAVAIGLIGMPDSRQQALGVVQADEARLGFGRGGTIEELFVEPGTIVAPGTLLARLSGEALDAQLHVTENEVAVVVAELAAAAKLHAQLAAARAIEDSLADMEHTSDGQANHTRRSDALLRLDIEAREQRLSVLATQVTIDTQRLSLERIDAKLERARSLSDQGVGLRADTEDLDLERNELLGRIAANEGLLVATQAEAEELATRLEAERAVIAALPEAHDLGAERDTLALAASAADVAALQVIERRLQVQRAEVAALRVELGDLNLRSSIEGRVAMLDAFAGQAVMAGAPVVTVQSQQAASVVVYLAEPLAKDEPLPRSVQLARASAPRSLTEARVLGFGTGVELMPERLWLRPDRPSYGRSLVIEPPSELGLIPGEAVLARLP